MYVPSKSNRILPGEIHRNQRKRVTMVGTPMQWQCSMNPGVDVIYCDDNIVTFDLNFSIQKTISPSEKSTAGGQR